MIRNLFKAVSSKEWVYEFGTFLCICEDKDGCGSKGARLGLLCAETCGRPKCDLIRVRA